MIAKSQTVPMGGGLVDERCYLPRLAERSIAFWWRSGGEEGQRGQILGDSAPEALSEETRQDR